MITRILTTLLLLLVTFPVTAHAQSGDATWLNEMGGLQTGIGRSWMAPLTVTEEYTETEYNEEGTPVSEVTTRNQPSATPTVTDDMSTMMLSALIFEYDTDANAEKGIELFYAAQAEQISRDPRSPATDAFEADHLGNIVYGTEGILELVDIDGSTSELAVVYLLVQEGNIVYQIFGQFLPGTHLDIATDVAEAMINAEAGSADPVYHMNGHSTGGLWEKLNAIELAMPDDSMIADLEVYPPADDAVMGDSVVMPQIDLDSPGSIPGISGSWHITYAPQDSGVLVSTPNVLPPGVFNIELWVMTFNDATFATAAAISLNNTLSEPLGIVSTEGGGFFSDERQGLTLVGSGFVQDRSIPEGDAAVVVTVEDSTLYAARVYSNGPAPTPLAHDLIASMMDGDAGPDPEVIDGTLATGGVWDIFPQTGDALLDGLEPVIVRHDEPELAPPATPAGQRHSPLYVGRVIGSNT